MSSSDRMSAEVLARLAGAICATAETLGQTISSRAAELMAEDLADYPQDHIRAALQACRRELTGKLTLAAILQRVQAYDGRPEPNEAWALALAASDESDSVVLNEEIQLALGAARAVLEAGDKIGARMAFLSAYQRFVDAARREAKPVKWELSMGHDPQRRIAAVEEAGRLGRLPAPKVAEYVAQITHQPITQDGAAIAGLITGRTATPSAEIRERLQVLKQQIETDSERREIERARAAEENRLAFEARRAEQLAAIQALNEENEIKQ